MHLPAENDTLQASKPVIPHDKHYIFTQMNEVKRKTWLIYTLQSDEGAFLCSHMAAFKVDVKLYVAKNLFLLNYKVFHCPLLRFLHRLTACSLLQQFRWHTQQTVAILMASSYNFHTSWNCFCTN